MRVPHDSLVVVAESRKLLFFRTRRLASIGKQPHSDAADHDQKSDRAGRAPCGASVGETDRHQLEEDRFAAEAADLMRQRALRDEDETLRRLPVGANWRHLVDAESRLVVAMPRVAPSRPAAGKRRPISAL